jgi:segregation and condensation protein A
MAEYKVQFEVFEGPLDLLLYLIKKEEVDIYEVNLTKLATQFIEYIDLMRQFDLEVAGEFLVMASTLMFIKSRELLPVDKQVQVEPEEEGEDPRWELIRQLVEYKKFKDAAAQLQLLEDRQENVYPRLPVKIEFVVEEVSAKPEAGIFDLLNAVNVILKRFQEKTAGNREIFQDKWSVSEKIEFVLEKISSRGKVRFSELFEAAASRTEVICTFLAILELIRMKQLSCVQPEPFAEIEIGKAEAELPAEPVAPTVENSAAEALAISAAETPIVEKPAAEAAPIAEPPVADVPAVVTPETPVEESPAVVTPAEEKTIAENALVETPAAKMVEPDPVVQPTREPEPHTAAAEPTPVPLAAPATPIPEPPAAPPTPGAPETLP